MVGVRRQRADTERRHVKHSESIMTTYVERAQKQKLRDRRAAEMRLKNNRLGMNIFQISWIMAFVALVIVNWQLRFSYAQWPPAGVAPFDPLLPSIGTLALLFSSLLVQRGLKGLRASRIAAFLNAWRLAIALGLIFMAIIVYEFVSVSDAAMSTQYGVTFRLMSGFHFVHALVILGIMIRVYQNGDAGKYSADEHNSWAVEGAARLWHFVTVAWILFYVVLYWIR